MAKQKGKKRAAANSAATNTSLLENSEEFNTLYDKNSAESQAIRRTLNEKIDGLISIHTKEFEAQLQRDEDQIIYMDTTKFTP